VHGLLNSGLSSILGFVENKLSNQATDWREGRRLRAWELKQEGWKQRDIARALGVTPGAVSQWVKRAEEGGVEALRRGKAPGGPSRLTAEQRAQIPELLKRGAESFGFRGDIWTRGRVAEVIRRELGVSYHPSHVGRILRACGWSLQKPIRRATQRDTGVIGGCIKQPGFYV
jgi:transposase